MQTLKPIIYLSFVFALTGGSQAYGQDAEPVTDNPATEPAIIDAFTAADSNADGALNREEFTAFVLVKADSGDLDYKGVKLSGEYDNHFNTKDYNADGLLTAEELGIHEADHKSNYGSGWEEPKAPADIQEPEEVN